MTLDPQAHDRMRDRDVIEAVHLLKKVAAQQGVSIEALASEVLAREMRFNRDAANAAHDKGVEG